MPTLTRTIITPIVTEQTSTAYQDRGEYTFRVHPKATKTQIRKAVRSSST
jgi:large subunit ribosomal protein L23